ncbi:MAG: hypothetical protein AAFZ65_13425, partial [Planctomycetota bacterium]
MRHLASLQAIALLAACQSAVPAPQGAKPVGALPGADRPSFAHEEEEHYQRLTEQALLGSDADTSALTAELPFERIEFRVRRTDSESTYRAVFFRSGRVFVEGRCGAGDGREEWIPVWWYARLCSVLETIDALRMAERYPSFSSHPSIITYTLHHFDGIKRIEASNEN